MTEKEIDNLRKKFLDAVEDEEEDEKLIKDLEDEFLKDEMIALLKCADIEVKKNWTKYDIAEKMLSKDFKEKIKENFSPPEEEEDIEIKKRKDKIPLLDDFFSPSKLFMNFSKGEYDSIEGFWEDLQKEIKGGFEEFKFPPKRYWERVEKDWKKRVRKIEKNLEELSDTEIPSEELDELTDLWKGFVKEMNLLLGEIPIELQLRKNKVLEIIKDHSEESKEIISEKERDLKELYPLWFDMLEKTRGELEEARNYMENKEEEIYDHWEEFKEEFTLKMEKMAVEHADKMEDVERLWSSLSENFEKKLAEGFAEHDHLYKAFWEEMGREKPLVLKKFEEVREKIEKDYSQVVEQALESIKKGYEEMVSPAEEEIGKEEEIAELKKRIEELEEKLEEE